MKTLILGTWQVFSKLLLDSCWLYVTGGRHTPWDRGQQRARASPIWQSLAASSGVQWIFLNIVHNCSSIWTTPLKDFHWAQKHCFVYPLCVCVCASHFNPVWLFVILWTIAHQPPLSMGFSRQEYWSGLPCPSPWDLPDTRIGPVSLTSPTLGGSSLPLGFPDRICL